MKIPLFKNLQIWEICFEISFKNISDIILGFYGCDWEYQVLCALFVMCILDKTNKRFWCVTQSFLQVAEEFIWTRLF